jgi:hypothetical protein
MQLQLNTMPHGDDDDTVQGLEFNNFVYVVQKAKYELDAFEYKKLNLSTECNTITPKLCSVTIARVLATEQAAIEFVDRMNNISPATISSESKPLIDLFGSSLITRVVDPTTYDVAVTITVYSYEKHELLDGLIQKV